MSKINLVKSNRAAVAKSARRPSISWEQEITQLEKEIELVDPANSSDLTKLALLSARLAKVKVYDRRLERVVKIGMSLFVGVIVLAFIRAF